MAILIGDETDLVFLEKPKAPKKKTRKVASTRSGGQRGSRKMQRNPRRGRK
jgi:hypothetical protein